jgi:hypothetical protein
MIKIKSVVQGLNKRSVLISALLPNFDYEIPIKVTRLADKTISLDWSGNEYSRSIYDNKEAIGKAVAAWLAD